MQDDFLRLLNGLGLDRELKIYLEIFKNTPKHQFAVIKIGSRSITNKIDLVAQDLAFLSKLGLTPIVVHSCPKGYDETLTDKLVNLINSHQGAAINANERAIIKPELKIDLDEIDRICQSDCIPIISCTKVSSNIIAKELVSAIEPKKFIIITEESGIRDTNDKIISHIDLENDFNELKQKQTISNPMLERVAAIRQLLEKHPALIVEICSAENLLKELFTVKGAGTYIRSGAKFITASSFDEVDKDKVKTLIENSFNRKLAPNYFEMPVEKLFIERKYNAIAIVTKFQDIYYLDKFAVVKKSQGNGLGETLWKVVINHYPALAWRSTETNPINNWYYKQCDGAQKRDKWIVYWKGLNEHQASKIIENITQIPRTIL